MEGGWEKAPSKGQRATVNATNISSSKAKAPVPHTIHFRGTNYVTRVIQSHALSRAPEIKFEGGWVLRQMEDKGAKIKLERMLLACDAFV